jgi:hypothetical protein
MSNGIEETPDKARRKADFAASFEYGLSALLRARLL